MPKVKRPRNRDEDFDDDEIDERPADGAAAVRARDIPWSVAWVRDRAATYALGTIICGAAMLTIAAYEATGGVMGAVGRRAEELFEDMSPAAQEVSREVFLRLVDGDHERAGVVCDLGDGFEAQTYPDSQNLFTLGRAAIYPTGSWEIGVFNPQVSFTMGAFPPPVPNAGDTCYISDHTDIAIGMNAATAVMPISTSTMIAPMMMT